MKKYAVAVLSFYDNDNKIFLTEAESKPEAMVNALLLSSPNNEDLGDWANEMKQKSVSEILEECFNGDIAISKPVEI